MTRIALVVSDVDGTLLTSDKTLTKSAQAAVAELRARDIGFTIISSRPPRGLGMLLVPLRLATPFAALNGGIIAAPDLSIIAEHHIPGRIARRAIARIAFPDKEHLRIVPVADDRPISSQNR